MSRNRSVRTAHAERGVSLLEVIFALTIFTTVLISLSGMMWQMGRHTRVSEDAAARTAALEGAVSLALSASWDSLDALAGCIADSSANLRYSRCLDVSPTGAATLKSVRVVVTPMNALVSTPETLTVDRRKPLSPSPLNIR